MRLAYLGCQPHQTELHHTTSTPPDLHEEYNFHFGGISENSNRDTATQGEMYPNSQTLSLGPYRDTHYLLANAIARNDGNSKLSFLHTQA